MSEDAGSRRRRRRRSDAERSAAAVLDAASRILGQRPEASIEDIAAEAGVTRQTVYAHFASRDALLDAVIDRVTAEVVAALDAAELDRRPPSEALLALLSTGWQALERYPLLLHVAPAAVFPEADRTRHLPILDRLERLIRRGQEVGEFDRRLSPTWLVAATIALAHAAGEEVGAGRMTAQDATEQLGLSVLRVVGTTGAHNRS